MERAGARVEFREIKFRFELDSFKKEKIKWMRVTQNSKRFDIFNLVIYKQEQKKRVQYEQLELFEFKFDLFMCSSFGWNWNGTRLRGGLSSGQICYRTSLSGTQADSTHRTS